MYLGPLQLSTLFNFLLRTSLLETLKYNKIFTLELVHSSISVFRKAYFWIAMVPYSDVGNLQNKKITFCLTSQGKLIERVQTGSLIDVELLVYRTLNSLGR